MLSSSRVKSGNVSREYFFVARLICVIPQIGLVFLFIKFEPLFVKRRLYFYAKVIKRYIVPKIAQRYYQ